MNQMSFEVLTSIYIDISEGFHGEELKQILVPDFNGVILGNFPKKICSTLRQQLYVVFSGDEGRAEYSTSTLTLSTRNE